MAAKALQLTGVLLAAALLTGCAAEKETEHRNITEIFPTEAGAVVPENSIPPEETAPAEAPSTAAEMTLDEKLHQMFIVTPEALTGYTQVTQFGDASRTAFSKHPVGGLIYFSGNLETVEQTQEMLSGMQTFAKSASGLGLFLAVDEEGGQVARCADTLGTTAIEPMQTYGESGDDVAVFEVGMTIGKDIGGLGFNLDFAPVADVDLNEGNELGDRIFSSDPEVVSKLVQAYVQGLQSTGVAATLKHFPGLGAEDGNAHTDEKIVIERSLDQLRAAEFVPFAGGITAGADFVMVSHQIVTGVGDDLPACLSPVVCTDLLRGELGFQGLIVTDSLQMNTISGSYTSGEAAVMAVEAGVDVLLMPQNFEEALAGLQEAVESGRISEERIDESVNRILAEKEKLGLVG